MKETTKTIASNMSWIMVGRVLQLGLTFISSMLVTRYLGPTEFGRMNYIYSYIQLFIPICQMGLNSTVVKELKEYKDANDEVLGTMLVIRVLGSIIAMSCAIMLVYSLNKAGYTMIALLESFALLFQAFDCLIYFYQTRYLSKKSSIIIAVSYIITALFRIVAIIIKKDIKWFAFALSLDYIVMAALLLIVYFYDHHKFVFSFDMAKKLLKNSYHYILASILVVIYGKVTDTLLIGKMLNETSVGYYSAATYINNAWPFVLTAIIDSSSPMIIDLYKINKEGFKKRLKQLYAVIFYVGIAVALGITVLADIIIAIIYGAEFAPAVTPLRIVSWSSAFAYIGVARAIWLQCEDKNKYETYISLFGAIINVTLNYILIKQFGINGAAVALVLTQVLTNFIFLFMMKETRENAKLIKDAILLKGVLNKEDCSNV